MTRASRGRRKATDRAIEALLVECEQAGLRVADTRKNHYQVFVPEGIVTLSGSPSDRRSVKNARARIRRLGGRLPEA